MNIPFLGVLHVLEYYTSRATASTTGRSNQITSQFGKLSLQLTQVIRSGLILLGLGHFILFSKKNTLDEHSTLLLSFFLKKKKIDALLQFPRKKNKNKR
jgi:hypothetical protein